MKHFSDIEIEEAFKKVPQFVREELTQGEKIPTAIAGIGKKQSLRIDQIGLLAELNRNMLLGLIDPPGFLQEMLAAGIPHKDAREIMSEINQKIFVPLREEIQKGTAPASPKALQGTAQPPKPPAPPRPTGPWPRQPQPSMPRPQVFAPPPQSPRYTSAAESQLPAGMKFAAPSKEMGGIKKEKSTDAGIGTPLQQALRAVTPPQNLPGTPAPAGAPPTPQPPQAPVQEQAPLPPVPAKNPGSIDPYREPIG